MVLTRARNVSDPSELPVVLPPAKKGKKPATKNIQLPPAPPPEPSPAPYISATTAAYQIGANNDVAELANLAFSQARDTEPYAFDDEEGATDDSDSEEGDSDQVANQTILTQADLPPREAAYFHHLALTPARLHLTQTAPPPFPMNSTFFNRIPNIPSSPIVAVQQRPQKRKRTEAVDQPEIAGPSNHNAVAGPSNASNAPRLPTMQEIGGIIPQPTSSSTPKTVSFDDDADKEPRRRSKGIAKPWQMGFHTPCSRVVLRGAKDKYRDMITFTNAYPDDESCARTARACWDFAVSQNSDIFANASIRSFNGHMLRLIADTAWSIRGAVKSEAKRLVPAHYKLHPAECLEGTSARKSQEFTKKRVEYLLTNYRFLLGEFNGRPQTAFADIALPIVIERALFRNLGPQSRALMNPMPPAMVALAATAIHNALEEWIHRYYSRKSMKEEDYAPIYRRYCKKLSELKNARPNRYMMILTSYYAFCLQATRTAPADEEGHASDDDGWAVYGPDSDDDAPLH